MLLKKFASLQSFMMIYVGTINFLHVIKLFDALPFATMSWRDGPTQAHQFVEIHIMPTTSGAYFSQVCLLFGKILLKEKINK